jgi:hypothetical protein
MKLLCGLPRRVGLIKAALSVGREWNLEGELFGSFRLRPSAPAGPRQEAPALRLGRQATQSDAVGYWDSPAPGLAFNEMNSTSSIWGFFPRLISVELRIQRNVKKQKKLQAKQAFT